VLLSKSKVEFMFAPYTDPFISPTRENKRGKNMHIILLTTVSFFLSFFLGGGGRPSYTQLKNFQGKHATS
jgi:hypothetical protein